MLAISAYASAALGSRRIKDLAYVPAESPDFDAVRHRLDVYVPRKKSATGFPVVVFIHGGSWNSGSKNIYTFIGRRLAKQGVLAVIINYRLAPNVAVPAMADDCARAVAWVHQHLADYGGDPGRIYVMGHSAGGGLAGLLATDDRLFAKIGLAANPVKGAILDDPAGLDMFDYLTKMEYPNDQQYLVPFGKDPAVWRTVSPLYFIERQTPPMLLYIGERTYPSIRNSTRRFAQRLTEAGVRYQLKELPGKKHVPMVTQLFWKNNVIYRDLLPFVGGGR
ncbi:alpha/beta hydrolase [Tellurirhabdus rosea]|uniref:alpha/beta hydrolase n=1 Tax=Tellurirhabdus rosea TaxID=2674997 RepID=UPI00225A6834|nr:alpha/beta hydrolase [Tellurirhabdus rosea]